ncbi:hypothetical protein RB195_017263 [Necator americanus]|uniref:Uncharacterized protein n=1 Tax=Necator americanus TaxID=51031 RepID=A0ABR1C5G5_NECAM
MICFSYSLLVNLFGEFDKGPGLTQLSSSSKDLSSLPVKTCRASNASLLFISEGQFSLEDITYHEIDVVRKPQGTRRVRVVDYGTHRGSVQLP